MKSLSKNIGFNAFGVAFAALAYFLVMPIYSHRFGDSAFGLIAIFFTLAAFSGLLDLGFGAHLNRALSRNESLNVGAFSLYQVVRAHERYVWAICLGLAVILFLWMPVAISGRLQSSELNEQTISDCFKWIALHIPLQMPISLYSQGLIGLQRQPSYNIIQSGMTAIRLFGVLPISYLESFNLQYFFAWHVLVSVLHIVILSATIRSCLPRNQFANRAYALGVDEKKYIALSALTLLGAMTLNNLDRLILGSLVDLKLFGYYVFAWTLASLISKMSIPVCMALLPRLTALAALENTYEIRRLYLKVLKYSALAIASVAVTLWMSAYGVLLIYTGDEAIAQLTTPVMHYLVAGAAFNAVASIMFTLASAHGWVSISMWTNIAACALCAPVVYLLASYGGIQGAAVGWLIVNLFLLIVGYFFVQKKYLVRYKTLLRTES